jgi:hypothetical protein
MHWLGLPAEWPQRPECLLLLGLHLRLGLSPERRSRGRALVAGSIQCSLLPPLETLEWQVSSDLKARVSDMQIETETRKHAIHAICELTQRTSFKRS